MVMSQIWTPENESPFSGRTNGEGQSPLGAPMGGHAGPLFNLFAPRWLMLAEIPPTNHFNRTIHAENRTAANAAGASHST